MSLANVGTAVAVVVLLPVLFLGAAAGALLGSGGSTPSAQATADIPADWLTLYAEAAATECPGLSWTVLAAIGKVESDHGRSTLPGVHSGHNDHLAAGPMQFLAATFAAYAYPVPEGGADPPSPYDPVDAVHAAARYLCASGALTNLSAAIYAYNHSAAYVAQVLDLAAAYASVATSGDLRGWFASSCPLWVWLLVRGLWQPLLLFQTRLGEHQAWPVATPRRGDEDDDGSVVQHSVCTSCYPS